MLVKDLLVDATKAEDGVARAKKYLAKPKPVPQQTFATMMPGAMFPAPPMQIGLAQVMQQQMVQQQLMNQLSSPFGSLGGYSR
jgi:hypothetical protein